MPHINPLLSWILAYLYRIMKRRPIVVSSGALSVLTLIFFSFKWGIMCSNMQPLLYMKPLCNDYLNGLSIGNLCNDLCKSGTISSLECQTYHMGKDAVFSGVLGNNSIVFKLPKKHQTEELHWLDNSNKKVYPSEDDFSGMIMTSIKLRFNITINRIDVKMLYIHYTYKGPLKETEMENVWHLLQDNEYLALFLYEKYDIFPRLFGSCGSLYAVQKLNSISRFEHLMMPFSSKVSWERRVKLSVMILDFLLRLDSSVPEALRICDVKMEHFGITSDLKKIQYLDLDSVHPLSIANRITGNGSPCKQHSDCDFFDCRSFCNLATFKCQHGVANNNLQVVCEKVFLGWVMSGRVVVPGLLLGARAPPVLLELLESCANPDGEPGTPRAPATNDIRDRLYKLLTHLTS